MYNALFSSSKANVLPFIAISVVHNLLFALNALTFPSLSNTYMTSLESTTGRPTTPIPTKLPITVLLVTLIILRPSFVLTATNPLPSNVGALTGWDPKSIIVGVPPYFHILYGMITRL
ncbi:unknown [Methanobrevibacter smithii CAG:186]|uniref:Uncharacterized protein n=1 Tax=Methanobrevibacter smithii CAG:186 TaxID=1263088 RepID=R7PUT6_METSM|nr:unknown [Methanobrevibacter smithii CAG:186]